MIIWMKSTIFGDGWIAFGFHPFASGQAAISDSLSLCRLLREKKFDPVFQVAHARIAIAWTYRKPSSKHLRWGWITFWSLRMTIESQAIQSKR